MTNISSDNFNEINPVPENLPIEATMSYKNEEMAETDLAKTCGLPGFQFVMPGGLKKQNLIILQKIEGEENKSEDGRDYNSATYLLHKIVGAGGQGEIWEASQTSLKRPVAIKRLRDEKRSSEKDVQTRNMLMRIFHQEAIITANLEHPGIVPVHDLGIDDDGNLLLSMKLIRGELWSVIINRDSALPPADYYTKHLLILISVAQAVSFAHSRGVIHRDLKPSQVMIGEFGEVLVMDWG
ncbi:MAG TPA: protein kinase, partial [Candidatus Sumerlaeota bacterium]|nr:protein kinase [Candidatus Sumerlaeota bacterium]